MLGVAARRIKVCSTRIGQPERWNGDREKQTRLIQFGKDVCQPVVLQVADMRDEPPDVARKMHHAGVADLPRFSVREVRLSVTQSRSKRGKPLV